MARKPEQLLQCVSTIVNDDVKLTVSEYRKECGHPGVIVELFIQFKGQDEWMPIAIVGGEDLQNVVDLLEESVPFATERMGTLRLPTLRLWGNRYFVDERLKELRNVDNPHDRVELRKIA